MPVGVGLTPTLPEPDQSLIPTVNIAKAIGWPEGAKPIAADGFSVNQFAGGLTHPRWLYVLPNGDVLVADSNAPSNREGESGLLAWITHLVMKRAGAGVPSPDRVFLLRDTTGDGVADTRSSFLEGVRSPFGMVLVDHSLYVAASDSIMRYPYVDGDTHISSKGKMLVDLTLGKPNHHWTKNIIASRDGKHLYVAIGSNSNIAEHGMEEEKELAAIWQVERVTGELRIFASGLRNPVGMAWQPETGVLWTVVNERDELGNDLVPDYLTSVKEGAFYGWPYSYFGQHIDSRIDPQNPALVAKAIAPDYALGSHVAALGLTFYDGRLFPAKYINGAFIGEHGSWNRRPRAGYKVVFVSFDNGQPVGFPRDFLTGFLNEEGRAYGRPVSVAVDKSGALLVADDVGDKVWRVVPDAI